MTNDLLLLTSSKSVLVLNRADKRLYHFRASEVSGKLVQLIQPEIVPTKICVWMVIRIPAQVTKVLHQNESSIEFRILEISVFSNFSQHRSARFLTRS